MLDLKGYGPSLLDGAWLTLHAALVSLAIAVVLGMTGALLKVYGPKPLAALAQIYTTLIRGVPDLVLMLLIFFGGQSLVNELAPMVGYDDYVDIDPYIAGVSTLGFIYGAYMVEAFRGALIAVPHGQMEAAYAFGMQPTRAFRRVMLPQMIRFALPGFGNVWLVLLKSTALLSVIGLDDMMRKASLAGGATREPFTFLLAVAILYLAMTTVSVLLLQWAERRFNIGFARP